MKTLAGLVIAVVIFAAWASLMYTVMVGTLTTSVARFLGL